MALQTAVYPLTGFGVPGELWTDAPVTCSSYIINSASASYNIVGATCFSFTSQGNVAAGNSGGTAVFAGLLVNPKEYANYNGNLSPTLQLPNYTQAALLTEGVVVVTLPASCNIGDYVIYDNTTGAISTVAPGTSLPSGKSWAYAYVYNFTPSASGSQLGVIKMQPELAITLP